MGSIKAAPQGGRAMKIQRVTDLEPDVAKRYAELRSRYHADETYRAVVDMYRNLLFEPEIASHFMAEYDMATYVHEDTKEYRPLAAKYEQREIEYLAGRGIKLV